MAFLLLSSGIPNIDLQNRLRQMYRFTRCRAGPPEMWHVCIVPSPIMSRLVPLHDSAISFVGVMVQIPGAIMVHCFHRSSRISDSDAPVSSRMGACCCAVGEMLSSNLSHPASLVNVSFVVAECFVLY